MSRAPGATPIVSAPSCPTAKPEVAVPWPASSHGAGASDPHAFPGRASCTASCQL